MAGLVVCEYPSRATEDRVAKWRVVFENDRYWLLWIRGLTWPHERVTSRHAITEKAARAHWAYARKMHAHEAAAKSAKYPPWSKANLVQTGSR